MATTFMRLTDDERAWVEAQLAAVDKFVGDCAPEPIADGLVGVDQAWAVWLAQGGDDADTVLNAVAVALGQAVVDALPGFGWVTVFQDGQTDLAVTGLPEVDAIFYPAEVVALEFAAGNSTFLVQTLDEYVAQITGRSA